MPLVVGCESNQLRFLERFARGNIHTRNNIGPEECAITSTMSREHFAVQPCQAVAENRAPRFSRHGVDAGEFVAISTAANSKIPCVLDLTLVDQMQCEPATGLNQFGGEVIGRDSDQDKRVFTIDGRLRHPCGYESAAPGAVRRGHDPDLTINLPKDPLNSVDICVRHRYLVRVLLFVARDVRHIYTECRVYSSVRSSVRIDFLAPTFEYKEDHLMTNRQHRRTFLKGVATAAGLQAVSLGPACQSLFATESRAAFKISLAEWSLHRTIKGGKLDNLDFAKTAKEEFGIDAIEYVNQFFKDKAKDQKYLADLKQRAGDLGVKSLLIMIDGEGNLGDPSDEKRQMAIENHYKWVEAAKLLGCHSIRVNAASSGSYEDQVTLAADGLRRLSEFAKPHGLNVIVENHGGLSSNGKWLAEVITKVELDNCGTLPDFGNFNLGGGKSYDRYQGVEELMPFAKAVSAKSHDFDDGGNETNTDYAKMMKIVLAAGYHGYVGIEYEGGKLDEYEGVHATKRLLERVREELA